MSLVPLVADALSALSPARPSWSTVLGDWQVGPFFVLIVSALALYVAGIRRIATRGRAWPMARSVAFGTGLFVIAFATQSGFARYDTLLFSMHVAQHLLLGMVAPMLVVLGAPVTLAIQASHRPIQECLLRVLHSRLVSVMTHPALIWILFGGALVVLYSTGLYDLSLRDAWVHGLVHAHFLVVGILFMGYVIGIDPMPRSFGYGGRVLFVAVMLPFHAFLGIALLGRRSVIASGWYTAVNRPWAAGALSDQRLGAGMLWVFGELFGLVALGVVLYQWMRHEELAAARADRRPRSANLELVRRVSRGR